MDSLITEINDFTWEETFKLTNRLVLVLFSTSWCTPGKQLKPILELIAKEREETIHVCSYDMDVSHTYSTTRNVLGVPTLMLFNQDTVLGRLEGLQRQESIEKFINQFLSQNEGDTVASSAVTSRGNLVL